MDNSVKDAISSEESEGVTYVHKSGTVTFGESWQDLTFFFGPIFRQVFKVFMSFYDLRVEMNDRVVGKDVSGEFAWFLGISVAWGK
jgi:hypothetical protein